ncbi:class I SAM-dependent methyltransferase, partial [Leptospira sp. SA-E8]|uniref:class I SAM-dependent methyltransferase n=1 Tax=Leptospira sp. SA-E8 TaxID=3422259 RepID=UPI003EB78DF4
LDVGCSEGVFFGALRDIGYGEEMYGVEPNPEFAAFAARQTGARVYPSLDGLTERFDLITLSHVFEHFLRPDEFLREIRKNLSETGLLYIDVPDVNEYASLADLHIAHLYHFSSRTLTELLEVSGFKVVACEAHRPPHHPRSVRLVAMHTNAGGGGTIAIGKETEREAWQAVRKTPVYRYLLRRKLAGFKLLRVVYRTFIRGLR